jgi:transposase
MGYVEGTNREQVVMFPEVMDDYVSGENPVRFVEAFVNQLELGALGFNKAEPEERGRPAYDPRDLLKLYIYGYVNEIRSSRKLERETKRNVELMWLMRKLTPDHKTIANFRKDNRKALPQVFRQFTRLCRELDLYGRELVGIDGSKFRAVNSADRNFTEAKLNKRLQWIEEKIEKYLAALQAEDEADSNESEVSAEELQAKITELQTRQLVYEGLKQQLAESGEKQISLTDPDARLMKGRQGHHVSYNVQIAVDSKHKLVADFAVTNEGNDVNCLAELAQGAQRELGAEQLKVCADRGYYNTAQIRACEDAGIEVHMERPRPSQTEGIFPLERFTYDETKDVYTCPAGKRLSYRTFDKEKQVRCYWTEACHSCPLKSQCTTGKGPRKIKRPLGQAAADRMLQRVAKNREFLELRKELVEHPFGTIKRPMGQDYFLMRGQEKVRGETSLTLLAYNLKRVIKLLGVDKLLTALAMRNLKNALPVFCSGFFALQPKLRQHPHLYDERKSRSKRSDRCCTDRDTIPVLQRLHAS